MLTALPKITQTNPQKTIAMKAHSQTPITIPNFHRIDNTLLRGAKPIESQIAELKNNGVKKIISFCTNYNPLNPQIKTIPDEANWAKKQGIEFIWLPQRANRNPSNKDVKTFFKITDKAREKGEQVFIHCRHGADRTGLFSAIYRLKNQNVKLSCVIKELMKYGHDANHHPNIIPFIISFKENMSPLNMLRDFAEKGLLKLAKMVKR